MSQLRESVHIDLLRRRTGLHDRALLRILRDLVDVRLAVLESVGGPSYRITFKGLCTASIHGLVRRGLISRVGERIGVGKESAIHIAEGPGGLAVVKFHRVGVKSFRHIRRVRDYGERFSRLWWGARSVISARREYRALARLAEVGAGVPRPLGLDLNALVLEHIEGQDLYRVRDLQDPGEVLDRILDTVAIAYRLAGIVHGDLSPYNVMISRGGGAYVIDWPQWVRSSDPRAPAVLKSDVENIVRFFSSRFGLSKDPEVVLEVVVGGGPGGRR